MGTLPPSGAVCLIKIELRGRCENVWELPARLAEAFLKKWYYRVTDRHMEPMIAATRTVKRRWKGILRWSVCLRWYVSRISNGVLEAINSLVQAARARACGYPVHPQLHHHGLPHRRQAPDAATQTK